MKPRMVTALIRERLLHHPAVILVGPRQCGKSTLARMLASPIGPSSILLGKVLVSLVISIVSMSVMVIATTFLLGARWGDPLAIAALVVAMSIAAPSPPPVTKRLRISPDTIDPDAPGANKRTVPAPPASRCRCCRQWRWRDFPH